MIHQTRHVDDEHQLARRQPVEAEPAVAAGEGPERRELAPGHDDETIQTLRRGMPTRSAEARAALRQGHRVSHARLLIADSSRQWVVTLHGADMRFGSARLPDDPDDIETQEERTADRAANWLALHEIVAGLFGQFLRVRVGDGWAQEAAAIAVWMGS